MSDGWVMRSVCKWKRTSFVPCNQEVFVASMFQWANTLTTSGQNMPLALPLRVDPLPNGFSLAFLMSDPNGEPGTFVSVGEIVASVEDAPGGGVRVLMIRGKRGMPDDDDHDISERVRWGGRAG